ncbi:MAG: VWA domain-containing protein [Desulfobacterales bacterium]|nr:VWA domain-containing protein [Desulfobacterales bacterium]
MIKNQKLNGFVSKTFGIFCFGIGMALTLLLVTAPIPVIATTSGYNVQCDPGNTVIPNPDGTNTIIGTFKKFNGSSPTQDLLPSDFQVYEDNQPVLGNITCSNAPSKKLADIVFCMDISGSMSDKITAVKANTQKFVNKLSTGNYDVQLGLITFGENSSPYLKKRNNGQFYASVQDFLNDVNKLSANGGTEEWFDALVWGSQYPFRPGASKVLILITDEPGDKLKYTIDTAIPVIQNNAAKVFSVSLSNLATAVRVAKETGGELFNIKDPFDSILDKIAANIVNTCQASYLSSAAPGTHEMKIEVVQTGQACVSSYKIGANPLISLSQATQNLIQTGIMPNDPIKIEADIQDDGSIAQAKIIVTINGNTKTSDMNAAGGLLYTFDITGPPNVGDYVEFYIQAVDNEGRSTIINPSKISVMNHAPVISSIMPDNYVYQQPIDVIADVTDQDGHAVTVVLKYKQRGAAVWQTLPMTNSVSAFNAVIPETEAGFVDIELEIEATDSYGAASTSAKVIHVSAVPVTIVEVTQLNDTLDFGPFTVRSVIAGIDLSNGGVANLVYTVGGMSHTLPMVQTNTGTNTAVQANTLLLVAELPAFQISDKICYRVEANNPTTSAVSPDNCFAILAPADPLALSPMSAVLTLGETIHFTASGGHGSYQWNTVNGSLSQVSGDKTSYTAVLSGLDSLTMQDAKGYSLSANINVLPALAIDPDINGKRFSPSSTITLNAVGGESPYIWNVSNATSNASGTFNEVIEITLDANSVTVEVILTDAKGRTLTTSFTNNGLMKVDPCCDVQLALDAQHSFQVTGGQPPYNWTVIGGDLDVFTGDAVTYKSPSLAGLYHLQVQDADGNASTLSLHVGTPMQITPQRAKIASGETATFEIINGIGPFIVIATEGKSTLSGQLISYTPPLASGLYQLAVTDASGSRLTVDVEVGNYPPAISPATAAILINETKNFTIVGGSGSFDVKAEKGQIAMQSATAFTYTAPSTKGTDTITAIDHTTGLEAKAVITISLPANFKISPAIAEVGLGKTFNFSIIGGSGPFDVSVEKGKAEISSGAGIPFLSWIFPESGKTVKYTAPSTPGNDKVIVVDTSNGLKAEAIITVGTFEVPVISPAHVIIAPNETTRFTVQNVQGAVQWSASIGTITSDGTYTAPANPGSATISLVETSRGLNATASVTVKRTLLLTPLTVSMNTNSSKLFSVSGGVSPYTWQLIGDGTLDVKTGDNVTFSSDSKAGSAKLIVMDDTGTTAEASISIQGSLLITPSAVNLPPGGNLKFTIYGGSGVPYWKADQGVMEQTGQYVAPLEIGVYTITAKDGADEASAIVTVANIPIITPAFSWLKQEESTTLNVVGGTPPYTWTTSTGDIQLSGNSVTYKAPKVATEVTVTVTDNLNQQSTAIIYVDQPLMPTTEEIFLEPRQTANISVSGGIPPFEWNTAIGGQFEKARTERDGFNMYTSPIITGTDTITIRDQEGKTTTVKVNVIQRLAVTPNVRYMKRNESNLFTVAAGVPPYTVIVLDGGGDIDQQSETVFKYTAPDQADKDVKIEFTDKAGQKFMVYAYVESRLKVSPAILYVDKNATANFKVSGGTGGYDVDATSGYAEVDEETGKGTYTAPNRYGEYTMTVYDSSENTLIITVKVERMLPKISPSIVKLGVGESVTFMATMGTGPFEWSFEGGIPKCLNTQCSMVEVTATIQSGTFKLLTEDNAGNTAEASVEIYQPLSVSPTTATVYKSEKDVLIKVKAVGGTPPYEWILNDLEEVYIEKNYVVVKPRTDVLLGTKYEVICMDSVGSKETMSIVLSSLPGDVDQNGVISDPELDGTIDHFLNETPVQGTIINNILMYQHLDAYISQ